MTQMLSPSLDSIHIVMRLCGWLTNIALHYVTVYLMGINHLPSTSVPFQGRSKQILSGKAVHSLGGGVFSKNASFSFGETKCQWLVRFTGNKLSCTTVKNTWCGLDDEQVVRPKPHKPDHLLLAMAMPSLAAHTCCWSTFRPKISIVFS